jgi:CspA family cold shock protein
MMFAPKPTSKTIMPIIKKIAISFVIGLIAYAINELILKNGSIPDIALLLLFITTSFASQLFGGDSSIDVESERSYSSSDRETGTVKWFNVRKGYGFITRDEGDDVFVHFRNIEGSGRRSIEEGQRVSFLVTTGDKGLQADEVSSA